MTKLHNYFIFLVSFLPSIISQKAIKTCNQSCPGGQLSQVPYPFGFSSGCQIQLNCTPDGTVSIGEFPVLKINPDALLVNLAFKCGRSSETLSHLFGKHYAPTSSTAILMENCTEQIKNCSNPLAASLSRDIYFRNCVGGYNRSVSCYDRDTSRMFLDYEDITRMGCRFLLSGLVTEINGSSTAVEMQVVKLGWWLNGTCHCSKDAECTKIVSPTDGSDGHRCKCKMEFEGDGYKSSSGCRKIKESRGVTRKLIVGFSSGITGILLLSFVIYCRRNRLWKSQKATNHHIVMLIRNNQTLAPKRFKYSEIKSMTRSFLVKLGQGGYGTVYKGQLFDGQLVAVKLLNEATGDGEDFINEVASISRTSHVNIVALVGFCIEGKKRALMYEFMPNGSLDTFLRGDGSHLDWDTLFQIAKGIARGLEYLHRGCNTRIVHFDIKPHNILLDEEFVPKISDFGMAKLCKKKESFVSVMGARGTAGYMAPEVFFRSLGGASHRSDVYSYGMMILEMTGAHKHNKASRTSASEAYFPDWIYKQVEAGSNLRDHGVTTEGGVELARKMIMVGLWCIQYDPSDRPSISKVIEMLEGSCDSLQVPPKRFWSSPTRYNQGISQLDALSSTSEGLLGALSFA